MNFFNNELFNDIDKLVIFLNKISKDIELNLKAQYQFKALLLKYAIFIADIPTKNISTDDALKLINFLQKQKESLTFVITNISNLEKLQKDLDILKQNCNEEKLTNFFTEYENIKNDIFINNQETIKLIETSIDFFSFNSPINENTNIIKVEEQIQDNKDIIDNNIIDNNVIDNSIIDNGIIDSNIIENTLIISEMQGKIIYPYTLKELNEILESNKDKYSCLKDVIENEFTIPYSSFKNPVLSRFKDAFKLARKEHKSLLDSFNLSTELMLNYNLHPAIISACKNLDELDIYLSYLETNEVEKFDCFKIKFEIAPVISKKS